MATSQHNGVAHKGNGEMKEPRHLGFDIEVPLRDIRIFSIALAALGSVGGDVLPGGEEGRDDAMTSLAFWIQYRTEDIDKIVSDHLDLKRGGPDA